VLEVVETVDGRLTAADTEPSPSGADSVWLDARTALCEVLAGVTIADIVEREAQAASAPMFFI